LPFLCADSSSPSLARRGLKFFFRPAAQDEMFSATMLDFLDAQKVKGKKIETVGLFFEDTIFGADSSNIQRKLAAERGYKLVADIKYKSNSPSLSLEVRQLKSADPDVLLPSSYTTDAILLMRTMDELGYKPRNIVAQASGFSDKAFYDAMGDKAVGIISRASFARHGTEAAFIDRGAPPLLMACNPSFPLKYKRSPGMFGRTRRCTGSHGRGRCPQRPARPAGPLRESIGGHDPRPGHLRQRWRLSGGVSANPSDCFVVPTYPASGQVSQSIAKIGYRPKGP